MLLYLDFFPMGVQRTALQTAANICKHATPSKFDLIRSSIPLLTNHLQHADVTIAEPACLCFSRIIGSCVEDPQIMAAITANGLTGKLLGLITARPRVIKDQSVATIIRTLCTIINSCPEQAVVLHENDVGGQIRALLQGESSMSSEDSQMSQNSSRAQSAASGAKFAVSAEQLLEIGRFAHALLPGMPKTAFFQRFNGKREEVMGLKAFWESQLDDGSWQRFSQTTSQQIEAAYVQKQRAIALTASGVSYTIRFAEMVQVVRDTRVARSIRRVKFVSSVDSKDPRTKLFKAQPDLASCFFEPLIAIFFDMYLTSANADVSRLSLEVLLKMHHIASEDMLRELLRNLAVSSYLLTMLQSKDQQTIAGALQLVDVLMCKLPDIFSVFFRRNGVIFEIHRLTEATRKKVAGAGGKDKAKKVKAKKEKSKRRSSTASSDGEREPVVAAGAAKSSGGTMADLHSTKLMKLLAEQCTVLLKQHFEDAACGKPEDDMHPAFELLRNLCKLSSTLDTCVASGGDELAVLQRVAAVLADESVDVSSFEAIHSNIVAALLSCIVTEQKGARPRMARVESFCKVFFEPDDPGISFNSAVSKLVSLLHGVLNLVEEFPVLASKKSSSSGSTGVLNKPIKLELSKDPSSSQLRELPSSVVLIEPLASIQAVEDFLWPRVKRSSKKARKAGWEWEDGAVGSGAWQRFDTMSQLKLQMLRDARKSKGELFIRGSQYAVDLTCMKQTNANTGFARNIRYYSVPSTSASTSAGKAAPKAKIPPPQPAGKDNPPPITASTPKASAPATRSGSRPTSTEKPAATAATAASTSTTSSSNGKARAQPKSAAKDADAMDGAADSADDEADVDVESEDEEEDEEDYDENDEDDDDDDDSGRFHQQSRRRTEAIELKLPAEGDDALLAPPVFGGSRGSGQRRLKMLLNGHPLPCNLTVYQAVQRYSSGAATGTTDVGFIPPGLPPELLQRFSGSAVRLTYREFRAGDDKVGEGEGSCRTPAYSPAPGSDKLHPLERRLFTEHVLKGEDPARDVLTFLRCLYILNSHRSLLAGDSSSTRLEHVTDQIVFPTEFVNNKLTSKILRQVSDFDTICAYNFPEWCHKVVTFVPFLVPIECRQQFFYYTAFGPVRALQRYKQLHQENAADTAQDQPGGSGRLSRMKVKIPRGRVIESTFHIMHSFAASKAILEIEFSGEVGTGLGPTMEFYSLASRAFQARALNMWRVDSYTAQEGTGAQQEGDATDADAYVFSPCGLFPAPLPKDAPADSRQVKIVVRVFETLGRLLARAILDGRLLDLPLSPAFYTYMLGRKSELGLPNLLDVDPGLYRTVSQLNALCLEKDAISADASLTAAQKQEKIGAIRMKGASVEDLSMVFMLPGYNIPLKEGGEDIDVTLDNLGEYVGAVVRFTLVETVRKQMDAVQRGFNSVFSLESMHMFTDSEVERLACGQQFKQWSKGDLKEAIKADHGFSMSSSTVKQLINVLSSFERDEQRIFLSFVTGSPSLPVGGKCIFHVHRWQFTVLLANFSVRS